MLVNIILESLRDPIWQVGGGILALATLVLLLALRSPAVGRRMTTLGAYCLMTQWENLSSQRSFTLYQVYSMLGNMPFYMLSALQ
ncbi:MAG TPA: hypothetical protein DHV65_20645 [Ktedonobacter sp.]|nr:hypothetical protein [Ktedonobacter sp.]